MAAHKPTPPVDPDAVPREVIPTKPGDKRDVNLVRLAQRGVTPTDDELAAVGVTPAEFKTDYLQKETAE